MLVQFFIKIQYFDYQYYSMVSPFLAGEYEKIYFCVEHTTFTVYWQFFYNNNYYFLLFQACLKTPCIILNIRVSALMEEVEKQFYFILTSEK